jgi:4-diphosphocytidyl-2-C-methyl-D-erythritol kinase
MKPKRSRKQIYPVPLDLSQEWSEPAPAKVSLCLHVIDQLDNGHHALEGLTVFTQLCDYVSAKQAKRDQLEITGPFADALKGERGNIILSALNAFRVRWPSSIPDGLEITLEKILPVAAGIGGGSADAAATLRLANHIAGDIADANELAQLALELGGDVPMCLFSRTMLVQGIGEQMRIVQPFPKLHLVLANPGIAVPSAKIFRALKSKKNPMLTPLPQEISHSAALAMWLQDSRNDLQPPAIEIVPQIAEMIDEMAKTSGCILSRMSGSGATIFGLFAAERQAILAAQHMRQTFPNYWVAQSKII